MKQKNNITLLIMLLAAASVLVQSCGKDNEKYPSSTLSGRLTYQGQKVGQVYNNGDLFTGGNTAQLLLQQVAGDQAKYGVGDVPLYLRHDGSFTGKFFNGDYLVRTVAGKNPFDDFKDKPITVNGNTDIGNIEVVPYWWINNLQTTYTGGVFTATFNLTKPSANTTKTLQQVTIYLNATDLPDAVSATSGATRNFTAGTTTNGNVVPAAASTGGAVTVKVDLNTLTSGEKQFLRALGGNGTIWASIGVKTTAVDYALYSDPIQLQLP